MKYDVFISYRRDGGFDTAKHLNDLLVRDGYNVSFDIDTLRNGNFDSQLLSRIDQCKDFILIIDQHAFDRTLNPNYDPQKDWMRCELAYALSKDKNIIPVFLSGVSGFPDNLPSDIAEVKKKNGPEYNKYHFNSFYDILKKRFLHKNLSRFRRKAFIGAILFLALILCAVLLFNNFNSKAFHSNDNTSYVKELESSMPINKAKDIVVDVLSRRPITAYCFDDNTTKIVALINTNEEEGGEAGSRFAWYPVLRLVLLEKEGGVWNIERDINLETNPFYKRDDSNIIQKNSSIEDDFILFEFDESCVVFQVDGNRYLYFHTSRTVGGNATADVLNDFVAVNLFDGKTSIIRYLENMNESYKDNGDLYEYGSYPFGVKEYLLHKLEIDKSIKKVEK